MSFPKIRCPGALKKSLHRIPQVAPCPTESKETEVVIAGVGGKKKGFGWLKDDGESGDRGVMSIHNEDLHTRFDRRSMLAAKRFADLVTFSCAGSKRTILRTSSGSANSETL
jgi:hypothetical protein